MTWEVFGATFEVPELTLRTFWAHFGRLWARLGDLWAQFRGPWDPLGLNLGTSGLHFEDHGVIQKHSKDILGGIVVT